MTFPLPVAGRRSREALFEQSKVSYGPRTMKAKCLMTMPITARLQSGVFKETRRRFYAGLSQQDRVTESYSEAVHGGGGLGCLSVLCIWNSCSCDVRHNKNQGGMIVGGKEQKNRKETKNGS